MGFPSKYRLQPKPVQDRLEVRLPGSKSYTNRALLLAALAQGMSSLSNVLDADDTSRMMDALNQLGVPVRFNSVDGIATVDGKGGPEKAPVGEIDCGNAGTAIRFLTPFCALGSGPVVLTGNERMRERPIGDLLEAIRQLGGTATDLAGSGCPPIRVEGGGLRGGICRMPGGKSSQYFSALLMTGPMMEKGATIEVEGNLVSKPYIDMTIDLMRKFGVDVINENYSRFVVAGGNRPQSIDYEVEGDASAASYFLAAAAVTGKAVRVSPLPQETKQGDRDLVLFLEQMGCAWRQAGESIELEGGPLRGIDADMNKMSDVAQTLAVVALFAEGPTSIRNIANARIKETDRISALAGEISRLGATVEEFPDGLTIHPSKRYDATEIETYEDHRMAMSFAVAGLRIPGLVIKDPGCVSKTFPSFWDRLAPWVEISDPGS